MKDIGSRRDDTRYIIEVINDEKAIKIILYEANNFAEFKTTHNKNL